MHGITLIMLYLASATPTGLAKCTSIDYSTSGSRAAGITSHGIGTAIDSGGGGFTIR